MVLAVHSLLAAMVRKLRTDVKSEAVTMFSSHEENVKWKELDPAELAKIQSMCKDVAWKNHKCKPDVAKAATLLTACQEIITWKGRGDMRPEAATFLTSCKETVCRETISPLSTSEVHVLAVDDSTLDRKVIEKLLRTSSYKGKSSPYFFCDAVGYICHIYLATVCCSSTCFT